jgi:hypothetical protein
MSHHAIVYHSLEATLVPVRSDKSPAKGKEMGDFETGDFPFLHAAREARIQFAPHRVVGSYADYRRLAAHKGSLFG